MRVGELAHAGAVLRRWESAEYQELLSLGALLTTLLEVHAHEIFTDGESFRRPTSKLHRVQGRGGRATPLRAWREHLRVLESA